MGHLGLNWGKPRAQSTRVDNPLVEVVSKTDDRILETVHILVQSQKWIYDYTQGLIHTGTSTRHDTGLPYQKYMGTTYGKYRVHGPEGTPTKNGNQRPDIQKNSTPQQKYIDRLTGPDIRKNSTPQQKYVDISLTGPDIRKNSTPQQKYVDTTTGLPRYTNRRTPTDDGTEWVHKNEYGWERKKKKRIVKD
eukprot:SAG11_NODE_6639_length_1274_cov_138.282553_1_plen_191_part_00